MRTLRMWYVVVLAAGLSCVLAPSAVADDKSASVLTLIPQDAAGFAVVGEIVRLEVLAPGVLVRLLPRSQARGISHGGRHLPSAVGRRLVAARRVGASLPQRRRHRSRYWHLPGAAREPPGPRGTAPISPPPKPCDGERVQAI